VTDISATKTREVVARESILPIPATVATPLASDVKNASSTPKNTSPSKLNVDFSALRKTVDAIDHAETKKIANAMLDACEKRAIAFNQDVQNPLMATTLVETLTELEKVVMNDEAAIKRAGGGSHSLRRAQAVINDVKKSCTVAKAPLTPSSAPTIKIGPHWQEHRLRLEQQLLLGDVPLAKLFHQTLQQIADKGRREHSPPNGIFICYAWPDAESEQDQHLQWIQPFLVGLRHHLHAAGLSSAQLDIQDGPPGGNIYDYMKGAESCDFVLLIGTESLLRKHEWGLSAVCTELVNIHRKRIADHKEDKRRVLPLLISGDYQTSFPAEYELYNTVKDWKGAKTTYYQHLGWLVATLYGTTEIAFEEIWKKFLAMLTEGEQLVLQKGLIQDQVISRLATEQQQKKEEDKKRELSSRPLLGLANSGERKEMKRLSLAFEQTHTDALTDSWHLPQPNDHYFIGRMLELKKLNEAFETKKESKAKAVVLSAVSGLGGVGKTQLAIYHVHHAEQQYTLRLWFQAETDSILHKDYLEFAQQYKLPLEEKAPKHEVIRAVKRYLASQSSWLAVYDNAGSYQDLKDFLPTELKNGHLMITTRRTEWHDKGHQLEVDVFSEAEAIAYVKKLLQRDETKYSEREAKALTELVRELGYLPLALAQAGAYIKKRNKTIENYLSLYRTQTTEMLADKTLPTDSTVQPVATTWNISLKAIQEDEAAEIKETGEPKLSLQLLQAMSYLHPDHIPYDLLARWLHTTQLVKDQKVIERLLDKALGYLSAYSMIQSHVDQSTVSVHRLVQEVVRFQLEQAKSTSPPAISLESKGDNKSMMAPERSLHAFLLASLIDSSLEEFGLEIQVLADEKRKKALLPHLQALLKHHDASSSASTSSSAGLGRLLGSIGSVFNGQLGDAAQAKLYGERALEIAEQNCDKDPRLMVGALNNLALAYGALGDAQTSKILLERALKIQEQHPGKDYWEIASTLNNLASAYGALGDSQMKKTLLEDALKIQEKRYGKDHWQVACMLNNLAAAYGDLGNEKMKKTLSERALKIQEQYYGKDHWEVALILNILATAHGNLGDAQTKKTLLERALTIQENHYGKNHWQTAVSLGNLASAYGALGDAGTQKTLSERTLHIQEHHYGKDHWQVTTALNNLAAAHGELGDAKMQKKLSERALNIQERHYGNNHWRVAMTLNSLATACGTLGEVQTQKTHLERALKIKEQYYGKGHWQVAVTLSNLVTAHQRLGDIDVALSYAQQAYHIFTTSFENPDHPYIKIAEKNLQGLQSLQLLQASPELKDVFEQTSQIQQVISNLCQPGILALLQQGDLETARYYFESENIHFDNSEVHAQLAEYYSGQKHFSGAIVHLEQALSLAQHAKEPVARLNQFYGQLACVYLCHHTALKQTGKPAAEQQQAQTMAKKHFEEGIKGLADSKATDASFLSQQAACYAAMMTQAVSGNLMAVRQLLENYTKTLSTPPAKPGVGDAKAVVPTGQQEQKRTPSGATEQFAAAQLSDNPHRFLVSIPSALDVKAGSQLVSQSTAEEPTEEDELQKALELSLLLNQKPA